MIINTLNEYKEYAGFDLADTSKDTYLTTLANNVESEVLSVLDRNLEFDERTEYYDGDGSEVLNPDNYPIISVSSLKYLENEVDDNWVEIDYTRLLIVERATSIRITGTVFPKGVQNIEITYEGGYEEIPGNIKEASKMLFALAYKVSPSGGEWLGMLNRSKNVGGSSGTDTMDATIKSKIYDLLRAEKRVRI
jgi:hypothetical protein